MIEIIKHGKQRFYTKCSCCGCEFTYELSDLMVDTFLSCPDCGNSVYHRDYTNNYSDSILKSMREGKGLPSIDLIYEDSHLGIIGE